MRFGKLAVLTGVFACALAVFYGCSDDRTTSMPPVNYGSLDDPVFVPVKVQIDDAVSTIVTDVLTGLGNMYVLPGDTMSVQAQLNPPATEPDPDATPDELIAIYQNGWHFVHATYTGNVYFSRLRDSVMYQIDGTPVEIPTGQVDFIHYINNWTFTALDPDVSHTDFTGRNDFEISNLDQPIATINGATSNTVEAVYIAGDTMMTNMYGFAIQVTNLRIPKVTGHWVTGCPQSGRLNIILSHVYNWENDVTFGGGSAGWTAVVTFNNGTATITADNGDQTWRYECEVCTIPTT